MARKIFRKIVANLGILIGMVLTNDGSASEHAEAASGAEGPDAKQKTIDELKAFDARRSAAQASLQEKLATLSPKLNPSDQEFLKKVIAENAKAKADYGTVAGNTTTGAYLKPMQKPVDGVATDAQASAYLKPMQKPVDAATVQSNAYLKPMQKPVDAATVQSNAYLKPMQKPVDAQTAVFLKPMQKPVDEVTQAVQQRSDGLLIEGLDLEALSPEDRAAVLGHIQKIQAIQGNDGN